VLALGEEIDLAKDDFLSPLGNSAARRRRKIGAEKCHRRDRPIQTGNRPLPQRDHGSDHVIEQSADGRQSANAADDGERSAHRGAGRDLE
jgi:hypothetical protein